MGRTTLNGSLKWNPFFKYLLTDFFSQELFFCCLFAFLAIQNSKVAPTPLCYMSP